MPSSSTLAFSEQHPPALRSSVRRWWSGNPLSCNQILSIDILNFHALCGCCYSIIIGKELCCIVVYCSFYTIVDTLASTGSQKGTDIAFQYLTSVGNVYLGQKFSRNDCNIGFIPKVLTNVALYARNTMNSDFRKILRDINETGSLLFVISIS